MYTRNLSIIVLFFSIFITIGKNGMAQSWPVDKLFYDGMITIKVAEGFGEISPQKGNVVFGHTEMDAVASRFGIHEIAKRFRHRPIQKNSTLPDLSRIYKIHFPESFSVGELISAFSQIDEIEYAEPVPVAYLCQIPNDSAYAYQQYLTQIMAAQAWDIHHGEDGPVEIVVGINDTGVDWDHPDLVENVAQNLGEDADGDGHVLEFIAGQWVFDPGDVDGLDNDGSGFADDFIGWDFFMNNNNPDPNAITYNYSHGTLVAGLAAARTNNTIGISSVSWNIKYFPTQIASSSGTPWGYDAIIYAAEMGVDIISNSWATWFSAKAEEEAIAYANALGSIIVASAGNYETNLMSRFPAGYPGVISVAAVNQSDLKSSYSNWGPWVDVCAPGGDVGELILSTHPGGTYSGSLGTSMSTPMVAGLIGLLKSYHPTWNNNQLLMQVLGTADDIDALNPGLENELGTGRINAFRALSESNVTGPEELSLVFISALPDDNNGNGVLEQGETVFLDLKMRNRSPVSMSSNTTFTISCSDPDITLLQDESIGSVPYDSYFTIYNAFQFQVAANAESHIVEFNLDITSDIEITFGDHTVFYLPVMASGALVYEGQEGGDTYSGQYISTFLDMQGISNVYSPGFPETFTGFDMAFLSFGNWGSDSGYTWVRDQQAVVMTEFLEGGGKIYAEAPDLFSKFQVKNPYLHSLFGLEHAEDGSPTQTPVTQLEGMPGSLAAEMIFNESSQQQNISVANYVTNSTGQEAFIQSGDVMAVQNIGEFQQKSFVFSYCLAELTDNSPHNSRFNLLYKVLDFFGYYFGYGYVIANFVADTLEGDPGLMVQFTDWSIYGQPIILWEWDFDGDGITDSWDQDPMWQFNSSGLFSVSLTATTEYDTNTFTRGDYILINQGTPTSEQHKINNFQLFPNPARDVVFIEFTNNEPTNFSVEIYSLSGDLVHTEDALVQETGEHALAIHLDGLPGGIYLLKTSQGGHSLTRKFVVK